MASLNVTNPFTGGTISVLQLLDQAKIAAVISSAHAAFEKTRRQSPADRAALLVKIASEIDKNKANLASLIASEAGKPITLAEGEVERAVVTFSAAADEARRGTTVPLEIDAYPSGAGHIATARRFPLGVVYAMSPFNFPLNLVAHKIAPAIACGCPIVLKPSPRTPLSARALVQICIDCGVIAGSVQMILCDNALATHPTLDPRVRVVSFTGSAPVGWSIAEKAIGKKVILELGGNAAVVVHDDADLESAVPMIATGAFAYAGQSCISVQRVLVQKSIYDDFKARLISYTREKIRCGDPTNRDVIIGPMIDHIAQERVMKMIGDAVSSGATILTGGQSDGPCVSATLLENVPASHALCQEEAFAPLAVLIPYETFDEALQIVNDSKYGLQAGVFTRDTKLAQRAFEQLEVGGVLINQVPTFRADHLPYGGVKQSGLGREGPRWTIEEYTELRTLVTKL